jgi:hypothetical protein
MNGFGQLLGATKSNVNETFMERLQTYTKHIKVRIDRRVYNFAS